MNTPIECSDYLEAIVTKLENLNCSWYDDQYFGVKVRVMNDSEIWLSSTVNNGNLYKATEVWQILRKAEKATCAPGHNYQSHYIWKLLESAQVYR